ncbi:hypothetical protein M0804_002717 [Polistes exclamans]|nr:hypothetical protein M0804_002717 [Polistes exclamans]
MIEVTYKEGGKQEEEEEEEENEKLRFRKDKVNVKVRYYICLEIDEAKKRMFVSVPPFRGFDTKTRLVNRAITDLEWLYFIDVDTLDYEVRLR